MLHSLINGAIFGNQGVRLDGAWPQSPIEYIPLIVFSI